MLERENQNIQKQKPQTAPLQPKKNQISLRKNYNDKGQYIMEDDGIVCFDLDNLQIDIHDDLRYSIAAKALQS